MREIIHISSQSSTTSDDHRVSRRLTPVDNDELGNTVTNSSSSNRYKGKQHRRFVFTYNFDGVDTVDMPSDVLREKLMCAKAVKYIFQLERGEETNRLHYQGYVVFRNARTIVGLKALDRRIHWEVAAGNDSQCYDYCSKTETRVDGPWLFGFPRPTRSVIEEPRPWQRFVLNVHDTEPDNRTIYWFWDNLGNTGKTSLAKHLVLNGESIYVSGKAADVKFAVLQWVTERKPFKTVIWDITRSQEGFVSYDGIESIKNGIFFSTKYESQSAVFEPPHIFVFANFPPELEKLSQDRWKVYNIPQLEDMLITPPTVFTPISLPTLPHTMVTDDSLNLTQFLEDTTARTGFEHLDEIISSTVVELDNHLTNTVISTQPAGPEVRWDEHRYQEILSLIDPLD